MEIVADYGKQQFIIELKIWRGLEGEKDAYLQILKYMEIKNASVGYLLTFDFRKNKELKIGWETVDNKKIMDIII